METSVALLELELNLRYISFCLFLAEGVMDITGLRNYQASMSQSLTQATSQIFSDVRATADKVDQKKQEIADQGLQRIQESTSRAQQRASLIDTYA